MKKALLLVNLGTPDKPTYLSVFKYLRQFLMDGRVININPFLRFILVNFIICPTRSFSSTKVYKEVWDKNTGSPLLHNTIKLAEKLGNKIEDYDHWWNNINKVGITKYGVKDYYINDSKANLDIGKWEHVAWTYQNNLVTVYINGENLGTSYSRGPLANGAILYWNIIGKSSHSLSGEIDELRIWNDVRTESEINDNMFNELDGDEAGLVAYYKMSNGSGTTVSDNSSNTYNGTMVNMSTDDWVTSHAPIGNLNSSYQTDVKGIWKKTGTENSEDSNGLKISVSTELAEANFSVFGNNNSSGTTTTNLPSGENLQKRSSREWQIEEKGTVSADLIIDISDATGNSVSPAAASNYKLLYKSCVGCDFTVKASGSTSSNDIITFSDIALQDGFYSLASTDTNL